MVGVVKLLWWGLVFGRLFLLCYGGRVVERWLFVFVIVLLGFLHMFAHGTTIAFHICRECAIGANVSGPVSPFTASLLGHHVRHSTNVASHVCHMHAEIFIQTPS